jgi:hypothetical protein
MALYGRAKRNRDCRLYFLDLDRQLRCLAGALSTLVYKPPKRKKEWRRWMPLWLKGIRP